MVVILPHGLTQNFYSYMLISIKSKCMGVRTIFILLKIINSFSIILPSMPIFNSLTLSLEVSNIYPPLSSFFNNNCKIYLNIYKILQEFYPTSSGRLIYEHEKYIVFSHYTPELKNTWIVSVFPAFSSGVLVFWLSLFCFEACHPTFEVVL